MKKLELKQLIEQVLKEFAMDKDLQKAHYGIVNWMKTVPPARKPEDIGGSIGWMINRAIFSGLQELKNDDATKDEFIKKVFVSAVKSMMHGVK